MLFRAIFLKPNWLGKSFTRACCTMSQEMGSNRNKVYKVVLTGGPCGGKTTGQTRLCTFFENLGWKVYRIPECAFVLMSGGIKWTELTAEQAYHFQENLIKTMFQVEATFADLAKSCPKNCLVICDRGIMDASSYLDRNDWERMKSDNNWNEVDIRDTRYNQVIHMVSAAKGAEAFYTTDNHATRYESIDGAIKLDNMTAQAWVGHPYYDVIDNTVDFETKIMRMISSVCHRLGIDAGDRLSKDSKKRKFLVSSMPDSKKFPQYQDFEVVHDYLVTPSRKMQARLRRRGQNDNFSYTHTIRRPEINQQSVELKMNVQYRDYEMLLAQRDDKHNTVYKKRRCFLWNNQYFQLDMYTEPYHSRCKDLVLLETYTTMTDQINTPPFLSIVKEVTDDPAYSMFNLSLKNDWTKNVKDDWSGRKDSISEDTN